MNDKARHAFAPKRRFPEFRDTPGWEEKTISEISDVNPEHEGLPKSFVYIDLESVESGKLLRRTEISRDSAPSRAQRLLQRYDVLFQTVRPYQRNNFFFDIEDDCEYVASTGYAQLRAHDSPGFLFQLVHTDSLVNKVLARCTGSSYPAINSSHLGELQVAVPSPKEQEKVADCLGSLDDLIAAEGRKLDALRDHKKGLLQQLFPQPGETRPRLRFPEFEDAGDWETKPLGPMTVKVGSGITPTGGSKVYTTEGHPFVRSQNVGWGELLLDEVVFIDDKTHRSFDSTELQLSDVLLNITGASIGRSALVDSRITGGNVNQHVCVIRTKPTELNPVLLNQYFISEYGQKQVDSFQAGGNRQGLNFAQVRSFMIPCPSTINEQVRIADCLTSLDTIAFALTERIFALQTHKQGLMQQLFPSPEKAGA